LKVGTQNLRGRIALARRTVALASRPEIQPIARYYQKIRWRYQPRFDVERSLSHVSCPGGRCIACALDLDQGHDLVKLIEDDDISGMPHSSIVILML
jgi:hypothetical protein